MRHPVDAGPIRYPENHVVGIVDNPEAATEAIRSLTSGGFLPSEVTIACGPQTADQVRNTSGSSGVLGALMRVAE